MPIGESYQEYLKRKKSESSNSENNIDNLNRQISNAQTRINDAGFSVKNAGDDRNDFEKWANLPKGQNWFFDTLELLGRGGNAVRNVVDKSLIQNREDVGTALYRGLAGREKVQGSDLIKKAGITGSDPLSRITRTGLGVVTDLVTDPTSFIPAGVIANGVGKIAKPIANVSKRAYNALEEVSPALKDFRELKVEPNVERVKDAFGNIFNNQYKMDQTLYGTKDDALKELATKTENSRRIMQEDTLKSLGEVAKKAGGVSTGDAVGRLLEAPLKQTKKQFQLLDGTITDNSKVIDGMINSRKQKLLTNSLPRKEQKAIQNEIKQLQTNLDNPVQIPIQRPLRELSSDPKIQQAANQLMQSNQALRQFAEENGIGINELQGYMTHVWSQEERNLRKTKQIPSKVDQGRFGIANPNSKILNQRELTGSVEDINEKMGRKFFEPNAYFSNGIGQKRLIDYVHSMKLRKEVLENPNFAIPYNKGDIIPENAKLIDVNNYRFIRDSGDVLGGLSKGDTIGGEYIVTNAAKKLLDRYQKINTDEGINSFLKAFDSVQNTWKRFALFSAGYHVRNIAGAMWNNFASGMPAKDIVSYSYQAMQDVRKSLLSGKDTTLYREFKEQGLGSNNLSSVEFARSGQEPEQAIIKTIENMSKTNKQKVIDKAKIQNWFETSRETGDFFDQINRLALYKYTKDQALKNGLKNEEAIKQAANKVKEVQFDYTNLTPIEQQLFSRVIPFYRWSRMNIPFQLRSFINDPRRVQYLNNVRKETQKEVGIKEENRPSFMNNNFSIPFYGRGGKGQMVGLNLPIEDLIKLSKPYGLLTDSLSPVVKLPIELSANYNLYRKKPIEQFEGQDKKYIGGFALPAKTAYALEQITGQPGRFLSSQLSDQTDKDNQFRLPSFGISSITKPFDAEQAQYLERLQQLKALQDYIRFIEQQTGEKPRTVSQIKKNP